MTPDDPRHGQRSGYLAGCRETCCTVPNFRVSKRYRHEARLNGGRTTVDPAPVRAHLEHLQTRMSLSAIADVAGSSASHLQKIMEGAHPAMLRGLAARIMAVTLDTPIGTHWVDATGSRRRIQALAVIGYSFERVALMVGTCGPFNLREIAYGKRSRIRFDNEQRIKAVYERIIRTGKPYTPSTSCERQGAVRIMKRAKASGWVSALAWDDDTINDPTARPVGMITAAWEPAGNDDARIERRINGDRTVRLHRGESVEVVRRMLAAGHTQADIRRLTGLKPERYLAEIRATPERQEDAA